MKQIYSLLVLFLAVAAFTGCDRQQDEYFSESSAKRADDLIAADKQVLTSVPTWKLEYFPGAGMDYGGYSVYLSFGTDGKVTVQSEIADADQTAESLYTVAQSGGPVLSMDTYNEIFTYFSEPASGTGSTGTGMGGDNDFLILKASTDSVILKSLKHGFHYKMVPFTGSVSDEITTIQDGEEEMSFPQYNMVVNGTEVEVTKSYRTLTFTYMEGENEMSVTAPYIQTATGWRFYEPVTILGTTVSEFTYDASSFTFTDASGISMTGYVPPLSTTLTSDLFCMSGANISDALLTYFKTGASKCSTNGYAVQLLGFYTDSDSGEWGLFANCGGYYGVLPLTIEAVADDEVTLTYNASAGTSTTWLNNGSYFRSWGLYYALYALTGSTSGTASKTWKLSTDNLKSPTWIKFVNVEDETQYFTVTVDMVYNPFA